MKYNVGLMLHFPMDTIDSDTLIGDLNATTYNNPTLVDGIRRESLYFNGIDQWADYGIHEYTFHFKHFMPPLAI